MSTTLVVSNFLHYFSFDKKPTPQKKFTCSNSLIMLIFVLPKMETPSDKTKETLQNGQKQKPKNFIVQFIF
jgi:hypothetical protein